MVTDYLQSRALYFAMLKNCFSQNLNNSSKILSDKEKAIDKGHKIPKRYGEELEVTFCRAKSKK